MKNNIKVGYLGDETSFGFAAASKYFHKQHATFQGIRSHYHICQAVGENEVDFGVVAVENLLNGPVTESLQAVELFFRKYGIRITAEIVLKIEMHVMRKKGSKKGAPRIITSHDAAVRQCQQFVAKVVELGAIQKTTSSTSQATSDAEAKEGVWCLGSLSALKKKDLEVVPYAELVDLGLVQPLVKYKNTKPIPVSNTFTNYTRFWIMSRELRSKSKHDKTCLLINLDQSSKGSLAEALAIFSKHGINLLVLFPNPILGRMWEYTFLLQYEGHIHNESLSKAYAELNASGLCPGAPLVLGSFPVANEAE